MTPYEVTTDSAAGWIEVGSADLTALIEVSDERAEALKAAVGEGLVSLLEALADEGLSAMPPFVLVDRSGPAARVLLRGTARVRHGEVVTSADGLLPWRELTIDPTGDVVLAAPEEPKGWRRPSFLARLGEAAEHSAPDAAPAPATEPATESVAVSVPEADADSEPATEVESEPTPQPAPEPETAAEPAAEPASDAAPGPEPDDEPGDEPDGEAEAEVAEPEVEQKSAPEVAANFGWGSPTPDPAPSAPSAAAAPPAPPVPVDYTLPPPEEGSGPPADRVPPSPRSKKTLIDSVPWRDLPPVDEDSPLDEPVTTATAAPTSEPAPEVVAVPEPSPEPAPAPEPEPEPVPEPDPEPEPEPAPQPAPTPVPEATAQAASPEGSDVTMDRGALRQTGDEAAPDSPVVLAVLCPAGHSSPPHAGNCRACGRDIPPQQPFQTPRPKLGVLRIASGGVVPLDRGVLLGRSPKVNADLPASSRPHLVRLASKDNDISRNHAEVILEGWHVLVRDLGSTNGTTVTLPGQEPVRLRPTEDHGIEPGTIITLADEVMLTYEVEE